MSPHGRCTSCLSCTPDISTTQGYCHAAATQHGLLSARRTITVLSLTAFSPSRAVYLVSEFTQDALSMEDSTRGRLRFRCNTLSNPSILHKMYVYL